MKEPITKGERRTRNRIERDRMFAAFRKTLLQHSDEQIVSIISNWMNRLIGDGFELLGPDEDGGPTEDKLDDFCELLGFRLVSNATGQTYASCSAWRDIEADTEEPAASYRGFSPCREAGFSWALARVIPSQKFVVCYTSI